MGSEMIQFVWFRFSNAFVKAGMAFQAAGMENQVIDDGSDSPESPLGILQGSPPYDTVNFVAFLQEHFGQIGSVLACDARDQGFFQTKTFSL